MDGLLVTIKLFPLNFSNESCVGTLGTDGPFVQLSSAYMIPSEGLLHSNNYGSRCQSEQFSDVLLT